MKTKLTWDIIKVFLQNELNNSKHIMTWGTIGSLNIEHDIDTIITKKPTSSSSEFFKEVHTIFEDLNHYLNKNFKTKAVRFAQSVQCPLISGYIKGNKVFFHNMIYVSFPQMNKVWDLTLFDINELSKILRKDYLCIFGSVDDLFTNDFQKENYFENAFNYLYFYDVLNSNLPKNILLNMMNSCFKYIYKTLLKMNYPIAKNETEAKKYFYQLCDILDEKIKNKEIK